MRKRTVLFSALVVITLVGGLLASCAPAATPTPTVAPPAATPTTPPPVGPKRGGILKWARAATPDLADMVWSDSNYDLWVFINVFEPLVRVNTEGTAIEPALAESWDISDDGLVYTFHLRPGLKFQDGSPVTASDAVWSLDRARDPDAGIWSWTLANVEKIEAVDDSTVKITLEAPASNFLAMLSLFNNGILPQKLIEEMGEEEFFMHPIGTGPFKMTEWVIGDYIEFEKNPYYWELGADGEPLPYLDGVKITQVPEDTTRLMQVQSGDLDGTDEIPFSKIEELEADPNVSMQLWPSTQSYYVFMNHLKPPFDDVKVRKAMNYAIDRQALLDAILFGKGEEATSFVPKGAMCWNPNLEGFPYDLEKAKQLIAESNYPEGYEGLKVNVRSGQTIRRDIATVLKEMWAKIGIEVEVNEIEAGLFSEEYLQDKYEMTVMQWTNDVIDPEQQVGYFILEPRCHSGWENERAIELAEAAAAELDYDKRCEMYYEIQEIFNEDAVEFLTFHTPFTTLLRSDVKGFHQIPLGWLVWKETWLDR